MSEAGDDEAKYRIRFDLTGEVTNNSRDYTGKASATYNNGDSYTGEYKEGVFLFMQVVTFKAKIWKGSL